MGDLLGYARVSTTEQKAHLQTDALKKAGCIRVWTDKASGSLDHRPKLEAVLDHLRLGDTLIVWRLDRLGRNLRHLIATVNDLAAAGVGFQEPDRRDRHCDAIGTADVPFVRGTG